MNGKILSTNFADLYEFPELEKDHPKQTFSFGLNTGMELSVS
jgi:hypothetical protein